MNYKHLSQIERYQIYSLVKARHTITQIAQLLGRNKSTISRELRRNAGLRGYRPKQACELNTEANGKVVISSLASDWRTALDQTIGRATRALTRSIQRNQKSSRQGSKAEMISYGSAV